MESIYDYWVLLVFSLPLPLENEINFTKNFRFFPIQIELYLFQKRAYPSLLFSAWGAFVGRADIDASLSREQGFGHRE